ncbi:MAG: hypothetical protein ISR65_02165 [Bacteriovoracaceae bacterium]|nr:hypothetical protein [Bacteriovoracaceae bacterium]
MKPLILTIMVFSTQLLCCSRQASANAVAANKIKGLTYLVKGEGKNGN